MLTLIGVLLSKSSAFLPLRSEFFLEAVFQPVSRVWKELYSARAA